MPSVLVQYNGVSDSRGTGQHPRQEWLCGGGLTHSALGLEGAERVSHVQHLFNPNFLQVVATVSMCLRLKQAPAGSSATCSPVSALLAVEGPV